MRYADVKKNTTQSDVINDVHKIEDKSARARGHKINTGVLFSVLGVAGPFFIFFLALRKKKVESLGHPIIV